MNTQRPDQPTLETLMALGQCADDDPRIGDINGSLKANPYIRSTHGLQSFEWLHELSWTDACAVVKAVVRAEAARLTQTGGSVSAVKSAYRTMEERDRVAAMELAAWVVDHTDNDYIPFPMRKIRYAFEGIKQESVSWADCREKLDCWLSNEWARQRRVADELAKQEPEDERRRQVRSAVAVRVNADRLQRQQTRASAREKLLSELRALPGRDRLEHIAWDDTRSLGYYPSDFVVCASEGVQQLDPVTKGRFLAKLRERRNGPWHELAKRLEVTT